MEARAVVIGLDGAAWHLLDPLLTKGVMPRLADLRERGAHGSLVSTVPPVTPPAWTSAATGVNPGRHGIYGFYVGHAQSSRQELTHSGHVRAATVWEMANAQGARMGVFNVPLTYPPQQLDGWMISGMMTPGLGQHLAGFTFPGDLEPRIASWVPDYVIEMSANWEQDWRDAGLCERALASLRQRRAVLQRVLDEDPPDVVFSVLEAPDRLQHVYYRYMDPRDELYDTQAAAALRPSIEHCFAALDEIVGLLADHAGDDGRVLVCSDHGFTAWEASVHTNALLAQWGLLKLRRGARLLQSGPARALVPSAKRFLPTRLRRGAKRRTLSAIDWSRTRAFASPDYLQGVFVSLRGRDPLGTVDEADFEPLRSRIAALFEALRGPDGEQIVDRVWRSEEVFGRDAAAGAPDLLPVLKDHRFELDDDVFHRHAFTDLRHLPRGVHHPDGIVVLAGPGITPGPLPPASIMDVAPTALYMAGLRVPEGLDGSVMLAGFDPSHVDTHPIATMAPIGLGQREAASPYSQDEEAAIEESLRGLGYL